MDGAVRNGGMLLKIAAFLVSLALIAERAAGRSLPVRFLVLAILRRAESVATAFVAREIEPHGWGPDLSCLVESPGMHFGAADAEFMALRLRMLAAVLVNLAEAAGGLDDRAGWAAHGAADRPPRTGVALLLPLLLVVRLPAARHGRPHDTS